MEKPENKPDITDAAEQLPPTAAQSDADDMARLIEEAEQRGYIRGRNERIEEIVIKPLEPDGDPKADGDDDSCPEFLSRLRPGFWDDVN